MALSADLQNRLAMALGNGSASAMAELTAAVNAAQVLQKAGVPVDGVAPAGDAGYWFAQDTTQAPYVSYINVGTLLNPTWQKVQTGDVI